MSEPKFFCPRRGESPVTRGYKPDGDEWRVDAEGVRRCSWCGSMDPDEFMAKAQALVELGPTDKSCKVYVGANLKFYFQHLTEEQRREFLALYNAGKLKLGYPGDFYVLPFFMRRVPS